MPLSRIAAAVTALTAIAILVTAGAPSRTFLIAAGVILLIAAAAGFLERRAPVVAERPTEQPTTNNREPTTPPKEGSVLIAEITADGTRLQEDMQRVLGSIIADERGTVLPMNGAGMIVVFRRRNHAAAAVHAAQRMLSNVDAVSRRLERDVRIRIAVHAGALPQKVTAESETVTTALQVEKLTHEKRIPVLVTEEVVFRASDEASTLALVDEQPFRLFSFAPVQRTLPGF